MAKKNWIKDAIKHHDALRQKAAADGGILKNGNISKTWINKQIKDGSTTTKRQANLAKTLGKMNKRK